MYNYPSIQLQNNNQPYFHLNFFFSFLFLIGTRLLYQDYLARRIKSLGKGLHMLTRPCLCLVPSVFSCFFLGGEWRNRILLCRVDVDQPEEALQQAQIWDDLGSLGSRETHPEQSEGDHCSLPRQAVAASCVDRCRGTTVVVEVSGSEYRSLRSFLCYFLSFGHRHQVPSAVFHQRFQSQRCWHSLLSQGCCISGDAPQVPKQRCRGAVSCAEVKRCSEVYDFFFWKTALTLGLWMKKIITTIEYEWIWSICTVCTCIKNMYKQLQNLGFLLVGGFERSFDPGKPSYSTAGGVDNCQGLKKALAATKVFRVWKWGVTLLKSCERSETDDSPMDARTDRYG